MGAFNVGSPSRSTRTRYVPRETLAKSRETLAKSAVRYVTPTDSNRVDHDSKQRVVLTRGNAPEPRSCSTATFISRGYCVHDGFVTAVAQIDTRDKLPTPFHDGGLDRQCGLERSGLGG